MGELGDSRVRALQPFSFLAVPHCPVFLNNGNAKGMAAISLLPKTMLCSRRPGCSHVTREELFSLVLSPAFDLTEMALISARWAGGGGWWCSWRVNGFKVGEGRCGLDVKGNGSL